MSSYLPPRARGDRARARAGGSAKENLGLNIRRSQSDASCNCRLRSVSAGPESGRNARLSLLPDLDDSPVCFRADVTHLHEQLHIARSKWNQPVTIYLNDSGEPFSIDVLAGDITGDS